MALTSPVFWRFSLLAALSGGLFITAIDFFGLRLHSVERQPAALQAQASWQPWGGYSTRRLAREGSAIWLTEPERAEALMLSSARVYPLDSRLWLDLARLQARRADDNARLDALLSLAAAVEPNQTLLLWRASQLAVQAGRQDQADQLLRQWLANDARNTRLALSIAGRWHDDPNVLLNRLLPAFKSEYLQPAMAYARDRNDAELARAVLERLDENLSLDHPVLLSFFDFLLSSGRHNEALELWARYDDSFQLGGIANADFSRELGRPEGLNWRARNLPAGARIERDTNTWFTEPASLRLSLDGQHNLNLTRPALRIPVQGGQRYRLHGHWKAERLTTRALPGLWLQVPGMRDPRLDPPMSNFDWEPWAIEFAVPEDTRFVTLRLRRDATQAFDRYVEGHLWIDALRLERLTDPPNGPAEGES
ncbi:MAG: hypothetical protein ACXIUL_00925 [Wenzhouxiangella sp.]